jgi:hypothetical protein
MKSFRARLDRRRRDDDDDDDDDSTFSAPGFARGCSPKEYMHTTTSHLETFKLIKAQGES